MCSLNWNSVKMINIYAVGVGMKGRGAGGFASLIQFEDQHEFVNGDKLYRNNGCHQDTTPIRMAMSAAIKALHGLSDIKEVQNANITLYSDDKILIDNINNGSLDKWRQNGWIKRNGSSVRNVDLWKDLLDLMRDKNITFGFFNSNHNTIKNDLFKIATEQQKLASDRKCRD